MNTFPGARRAHRLIFDGRIIARALLLAAAVLLLGACSTLRLAYNQGPNLTYWWVDGFVDLNDAQSSLLRRDIDSYFDWHRGTELPFYVTRLQQWQQMSLADTTPEQSCAQFDVLRAAYVRLVERGLEPMARLALSLTPAQLAHLQRHQAKSNQTFEKDYLRGSADDRLERLFDKASDRYETLYGPLTGAQQALLTLRLRSSSFDPVRVHAERQRRQTDLLATLRDLQGTPGNRAGAVSALRAWHGRVMLSPLPGFSAYSESLVREACVQFALIHNSTSPEQRAHAAQLMKGYEEDLRALAPKL